MKQVGDERNAARMRIHASSDPRAVSPADPTGPRFRIEDIYPCIEAGRYPVKRIAGESVEVWADIFRDGHDIIAAALLWRPDTGTDWQREPMQHHGNDRWHGCFTPPEPGRYLFAVEAWTDHFATWRRQFLLKREAGQDISSEAREGHELLAELTPREREAQRLVEAAAQKFAASQDTAVLLDDKLAAAMEKSDVWPRPHPQPFRPACCRPRRARAGAWYEMVPRSQGRVARQARHLRRLHRAPARNRRARLRRALSDRRSIRSAAPTARARTTRCAPSRAILAASTRSAASEGGHDAVHPELGTLDDFRRLVAGLPAAQHGDRARFRRPVLARSSVAETASGVVQLPARRRRSATPRTRRRNTRTSSIRISTAPTASRCGRRLRDVVLFWVDQGVRIFRVDNPHTKPLPFWEWLIREVQESPIPT